jgi:hypothetical protein
LRLAYTSLWTYLNIIPIRGWRETYYSVLLKSKTKKLEQNMMRCFTLPLKMWFNEISHFDEL